jgi:ParB/RepB/Spo0J family partition protein
MTIELVRLDQIDPNPWQTRRGEDLAHLEALMADIKVRGLLQPPRGRRFEGRVQLAFGHSRLAAMRRLQAETMPVDVVNLADREMAEEAIVENAKRHDLSAIDKGRALRVFIDGFHVGQAEAGALFGLGQAQVSNLMRMLELPEDIQTLVHTGALSERHARELVVLAKLDAPAATVLAQRVANAKPGRQADSRLEDEKEKFLAKLGRELYGVPWKKGWPEKIILVPQLGEGGLGQFQIRTCEGCPFRVDRENYSNRSYCSRPECFDLKMTIALQAELERAAKHTGLPIAGADEKTWLIWEGSYEGQSQAAKIVATKAVDLRLVARNDQRVWMGTCRTVLGSDFVVLATADVRKSAAYQKMLKVRAGRLPKPAKEGKPTPAEKKAIATARADARRERAALIRGKYDSLWLFESISTLAGRKLGLTDEPLIYFEALLTSAYPIPQSVTPLLAALDAGWARAAAKVTGLDREELRRRRVMLLAIHARLAEAITKDSDRSMREAADVELGFGLRLWSHEPETYETWTRAQKATSEAAADLGLKLPANWNVPPVHKTDFNCHTCGVFAGLPRITKANLQEGWVLGADGIFCPRHGKGKAPRPEPLAKKRIPRKAAAGTRTRSR